MPASSGRAQLAETVAGLLAHLDPYDSDQREVLRQRLTAAGITPHMHTEKLPKMQAAMLPDNLTPQQQSKGLDELRVNYFVARELPLLDWPTDQRIEYELGKLHAQLADSPDTGAYRPLAPDVYHDHLTSRRTQLHNLSHP
ncbi:hypothetical protein [Nocardia suismassiliense]|uniref:hypothetical protein n=1 Tax=Nocardia suismassiliense TaxID=2077092 RepID=UPI00131F0770|nr:hypothetical protein [Nocardia suismassiliense]